MAKKPRRKRKAKLNSPLPPPDLLLRRAHQIIQEKDEAVARTHSQYRSEIDRMLGSFAETINAIRKAYDVR
jgi:hypothetical protein